MLLKINDGIIFALIYFQITNPVFLPVMDMDITLLQQKFTRSLLSLEKISAKNLFHESRLPNAEFIEQVVIPALEHIGNGWEQGDFALSQVYMSGKICEELVDELLPPHSAERKDQPHMAIAVFEDYHMLGKRIVYAMLRAAGYELKDYGRVERRGLVKKIMDDKIEVILLSALMLPSALHMKSFCSDLRKTDSRVKVIVGGAPFRFDPQLWREIGADGMAVNGADAIAFLKTMFPPQHGVTL